MVSKRFGIYEDDGEPMRDRRFDGATNKIIIEKFISAWEKANNAKGSEQAEIIALEFVTGLETYACPDWLAQDRNIEYRYTDKGRREKLVAVANAIDALVISMENAEPFDLTHALSAGLRLVRDTWGLEQEPGQLAIRAMIQTRPGPSATPSEFELIVKGMRRYIESATLHKMFWNERLELAVSIVRYLAGHGITATTSSTGLAGFAFEATFELAGLAPPRAGYWITKAKETVAAKTTC